MTTPQFFFAVAVGGIAILNTVKPPLKENFLIKIELKHFPFSLFSFDPLHIPPHSQTYSLFFFEYYCYKYAHIYICMCIYLCVCTNVHRYNLLSMLLLFVCIWLLGMTTLHWTTNKGLTPGRGSFFPSQQSLVGCLWFCLGMGSHDISPPLH